MDIKSLIESLQEMENLNHKDGQFQFTFTMPMNNSEKLPKFFVIYVSKQHDYRKQLIAEEVSTQTVHIVLQIVGIIKHVESTHSEDSDKTIVEELLKECSKG